jgi:putative ABC transport system permease protein
VLVNDPGSDRVTVIGVVADVRTESLEKQPPAIVYVPYWDGPIWQGSVWGNATYVMRTAQDPSTMTNALRSAMHELDTELPLANVLTMREVVSESVRSRRFQTTLAGVFSGGAVLLACLGIYGVISYSVAQRANEMGLRIALGAQPSQVSMLVLQQGMRPVIGGLLAGVVATMAAGRWIGSILFGIRAGNPAAISAVVALMLIVAAIACWAPAWRASRIDPMAALRNE